MPILNPNSHNLWVPKQSSFEAFSWRLLNLGTLWLMAQRHQRKPDIIDGTLVPAVDRLSFAAHICSTIKERAASHKLKDGQTACCQSAFPINNGLTADLWTGNAFRVSGLNSCVHETLSIAGQPHVLRLFFLISFLGTAGLLIRNGNWNLSWSSKNSRWAQERFWIPLTVPQSLARGSAELC